MYLRSTQRKNRDGSVVRYLQIAQNHRVNGTTRAEVLLNLGREDQLDVDGLRRLVQSISRYLGEPAPGDHVAGTADDVTILSSRSIGVPWLLDGLWHELGVDAALATVLDDRGFTPAVERALFAMVAHRATNPTSTVAEWITTDVTITDLEVLDDELADRAIAMLTDVLVQESVFRATVEQLRLDDDVAAVPMDRPGPGDAAPNADSDGARDVTPTVPARNERSGTGDAGMPHDSSTTRDETSAPRAKQGRSQRNKKKKKKKKKKRTNKKQRNKAARKRHIGKRIDDAARNQKGQGQRRRERRRQDRGGEEGEGQEEGEGEETEEEEEADSEQVMEVVHRQTSAIPQRATSTSEPAERSKQ